MSAAIRAFLPIALMAIVTIGGLYALFLREPGGRLAPHDARAVRMFADLYFTRVAFVLALIGYALVVWRSFWRAPALILTITTLAAVFLLQDANLAGAVLARAPVSHRDPAGRAHLRIRRDLRAGVDDNTAVQRVEGAAEFCSRRSASPLPSCSATDICPRRYRFEDTVEYADVIPHLERLASRFSDDDLVLFEARAASDLHALALPLSYIYARNTLVLYDSRPDKQSVRDFLTWAHERYKNVYFIAGGGTDLFLLASARSSSRPSDFKCPNTRRPRTTCIRGGLSGSRSISPSIDSCRRA